MAVKYGDLNFKKSLDEHYFFFFVLEPGWLRKFSIYMLK